MSNIVTTQADELRAFFARVRPCYRELFNMAHAICGNYELAEYAVQSAILDIFRRGTPRSRAMAMETLTRVSADDARILIIMEQDPAGLGTAKVVESLRGLTPASKALLGR